MSDPLTLSIGGNRFEGWQDAEITYSLDGFSAVGFSAPFEPRRRAFRDLFKPFSFLDIDLDLGEQRLFTGTMVSVSPDPSVDDTKVSVSAYSKPAVLGDVMMPAGSYPLEFDGLNLRQIAESLLSPFGLGVVSEVSLGAAFDRVAVDPSKTVFSFLTDLAQQRGVVITDTPQGQLLFRQSFVSGPTVVDFKEGEPPLISVSVSFSPQKYYSEITGLASTKPGRSGARYTLQNGRLPNTLRPHAFKVDDADKGDLPSAVEAKMGRMFGNMVSYSIDVPTWYTPSGNLWQPNMLVSLDAPGAMVYTKTLLVIKNVKLKRTGSEDSAKLSLVLPESFTGRIPARMPWDES